MGKVYREKEVLTKRQLDELKELNELSMERDMLVVIGVIPSSIFKEEDLDIGIAKDLVDKPIYFLLDRENIVDYEEFLSNGSYSKQDVLLKLLKK